MEIMLLSGMLILWKSCDSDMYVSQVSLTSLVPRVGENQETRLTFGNNVGTVLDLQILLQEDSDHYNTYTSADRNEFLFRLFKHLALGGPVNQV